MIFGIVIIVYSARLSHHRRGHTTGPGLPLQATQDDRHATGHATTKTTTIHNNTTNVTTPKTGPGADQERT